jgi:hypothetical protein
MINVPTIPTQLSRTKANDFNPRMKAAPYPAAGIFVIDVVMSLKPP